MSERYTGLPPALKKAVYDRDQYRCRWCGSTNRAAYDVHHIQYRRGYAYDVLDNLISLCRECHGFVHDSYQIPKQEAQHVLSALINEAGRGTTGMALWRALKAQESERDSADNSPERGVGRLIKLD